MSNELDNNRLKRLKAIDEALSSTKDGMTIAELIEKVKDSTGVEFDRGAIKRDVDLLDEMGYEIDRVNKSIRDLKNQQSRNVVCMKYRNPRNTLFQINMSQEERDFLSEALAMLGLKGIEGMKFFRSLNLKKSNKNRQVISFTKNPVETKVSKWFQDIYDAIKFKDVIKISVRDRKPPYKPVSHIVSPWYLREYNRRWYLFGFDEEELAIRRYTLDRISKSINLGKTNYRKADVKMDDILNDIVGVSIDDGDILDIIFWVSDESADYVAKKYIHHTQKELTREEVEEIVGHKLEYEGGKYFSIRCKENYELRRELLSFGPALVVVTPEHFRTTLRNQLTATLDMYR